MNRLLTILLLLGATAHGQINNPPTSVNIVDATATGRAVLTATNAAAARTSLDLGGFRKTDGEVFAEIYSGEDLRIVAGDSIEFYEAFGFGGTNAAAFASDSRASLGLGATWLTNTSATNFRTAIGLGATNDVTFSNVTVNGNISVGSLTTTTPSTWALDATQTAAATNGRLTLPSNANVIRLTNNNSISSVTNGVLGAFYYLVNQTTNAVTISNVGGITVQGGTSLTLGANQAATLVATGATNASVAARGDLTDVALGGTANTAPSQTASSGSSLMTRDLSDDRYFNQPNLLHINVNNFTGATVGGNSPSVGLFTAVGQTIAGTITNSWMKMGDYAAQSGQRSTFQFSKKMRAKLWFLVVNSVGSFSNSSVHYIFPTVSGYNAGQPSHKSFGFTVSGTTIKGFAHNGTNYNTTTNSVTYTNQHAYLGVVENNGAGVYSFWVNNNGTYTSLGTVSGPTGSVSQEFLFGANVNSTTTNDVNGYFIIQTVDFASEP